MSVIITLYLCMHLANIIHGSTLVAPPLSAVVVAFEDIYDLSLLANSLSDQGIDATLIIPAPSKGELYETLIDVEVLTVNVEAEEFAITIQACEGLLKDEEVARKIQEIQPIFVIFPAFRYSLISLYLLS